MKIALKGSSVKPLTLDNSATLQDLYERCADYALLVDGAPPSPTAARDEFSAVPEGKGLDDKFMFGLFRSEGLAGLLESIRHYPDGDTWWLGLLMLEPDSRGQGVGAAFYRAFERHVAQQGAAHIMLSVVDANKQGSRFWQRLGFEEVRETEPKRFGSKTHVLSVMKKSVRGGGAT